jgi:hypothetical protein
MGHGYPFPIEFQPQFFSFGFADVEEILTPLETGAAWLCENIALRQILVLHDVFFAKQNVQFRCIVAYMKTESPKREGLVIPERRCK